MSARLVVMGTLLALAALRVSVLEAQDRTAQQIMDRMLARVDPYLIREAEELGLYDREALLHREGEEP